MCYPDLMHSTGFSKTKVLISEWIKNILFLPLNDFFFTVKLNWERVVGTFMTHIHIISTLKATKYAVAHKK